MALSRRQFLQLSATSLGGALYAGCSFPAKELLVQSPVRLPEDLVTGLDNWYASGCGQCPAGCGVVVRVIEGRAKKLEGNPFHPVNGGKSCARGQAAVQAVYHPDRIQGPLRRTGERGSGRFAPISWDEGLNQLTGELQRLRGSGAADGAVLVTAPLRGHLGLVVQQFASAYGLQHLSYEPVEQTALRAAMKNLFGQDLLPEFDIARAAYVLSFGADPLGSWLSPVHYGRAYGEFRQGRAKRGTFVQVEPRFSTTTAGADEWVPVRPGTEGILALSLAQVIVAEKLGEQSVADALTGGAGARALEAFQPTRVAAETGVPAERIVALARAFAGNRPALAVGGGSAAAHTNGLFNLTAIYALNLLVGSAGKPGGLLFNPPPTLKGVPAAGVAAPFRAWQDLVGRLREGRGRPVSLLMVHAADPVYGLPGALQFGEAIGKVPLIVSFSSFMDDTAAMADLILPDHTFLESWGSDIPEPGPGHEAVTFQQPAVAPVFETRPFGDVLLTLAEEVGGAVQRALPWDTMQTLLREAAGLLQREQRGVVREAEFPVFWTKLLQRGGWWDELSKGPAPATRPVQLPQVAVAPRFAGDDEYHFLPFPSVSLGAGEGAHLPWLQATPDPLTTVTWQTWVELNPRTAHKLGLQEGDVVAVVSPHGEIEAPVYVYPAAREDTVAMPMGQGHRHSSRWSEGRGVNPAAILAPLLDEQTGALAWAATRVRLRPTGKRLRLPKIEGSVISIQRPGADVVEVTQAANLLDRPQAGQGTV